MYAKDLFQQQIEKAILGYHPFPPNTQDPKGLHTAFCDLAEQPQGFPLPPPLLCWATEENREEYYFSFLQPAGLEQRQKTKGNVSKCKMKGEVS